MSLYQNILAFLWAFLISVFAIPSIVDVAHRKKLLDAPNTRTAHDNLTPRLGGLAIFAGFISSLTIFGQLIIGMQEMLAGAILLFFIGLKDDIVSVSAFKKFFIQVLAAAIVMFVGNVQITSFYSVLGIGELTPGISFLFTFVVIIGVTNSINLIDGVNGLAGVIICLICFFLALSFYFYGGSAGSPYTTVALCLFGSVAGFLRYNIHKANIFMGDSGSLVTGFIVACLSVKFVELNMFTQGPVYILAILFIPIIDTVRVFVLRILKGISPFTPDKNHLHHRLMAIGYSHALTVTILVVINLGALVLVGIFSHLNLSMLAFLLVVYAILLILIIEVIYRRKLGKLANAA